MQINPVDRIGRARAEWAREAPDLDTSPMEIIGRILRAEHLADARIRQMLRPYGLDRGGFDLLATLQRSGPPYRLTPTELYRELVLTSGAVTHRVDALARAGLVERVPDPADRRSTLVGLTGHGRTVTDEAMAAHMRCEARLAAALSEQDQGNLAALLRQLLTGMEQESTEEDSQ